MTERELRRWHRDHAFSKVGFCLSSLGMRDGLRCWSAEQAAELVTVEDFDRPGECEAAAMAINRAYGFDVAFGWVGVIENGRAKGYGHCFNIDSSGLIVDAAKLRIKPTGYLGVVLRPADLEVVGGFLPSPSPLPVAS